MDPLVGVILEARRWTQLEPEHQLWGPFPLQLTFVLAGLVIILSQASKNYLEGFILAKRDGREDPQVVNLVPGVDKGLNWKLVTVRGNEEYIITSWTGIYLPLKKVKQYIRLLILKKTSITTLCTGNAHKDKSPNWGSEFLGKVYLHIDSHSVMPWVGFPHTLCLVSLLRDGRGD